MIDDVAFNNKTGDTRPPQSLETIRRATLMKLHYANLYVCNLFVACVHRLADGCAVCTMPKAGKPMIQGRGRLLVPV